MDEISEVLEHLFDIQGVPAIEKLIKLEDEKLVTSKITEGTNGDKAMSSKEEEGSEKESTLPS
eukprot:10017575-Ditylum_brightwellii.AAC.1